MQIKWTDFNPRQGEFVLSKEPYVMGSGGMGGGKTVGLVRRAILLSVNSPVFGDMSGNVGLLGRFKSVDFLKTTYLALMRELPASWIEDEDRNLGIIYLKNHSIIHYTHIDSVDHILGYNLGWFGGDQTEEIPKDVWDELKLRRIRLRVLTRYDEYGRVIQPEFDDFGTGISPDPAEIAAVLHYQTAFGVCNPKRCWIYDDFVRNEEHKLSVFAKSKYDPEHKLIIIPSTENLKYLPPQYIDRQKRTLSTREYKRYVEGLWDAFEGQVYEDFHSRHINGINIIPPPNWDIGVFIDHGGSGTPQKQMATNVKAVVFVAYHKQGLEYPQFLIFDSLYLGGSTIENAVMEIRERLVYHHNARKKVYDWYNSTDEMIKVNIWRCGQDMAKGLDDSDESIMEAWMRHGRNIGMRMSLAPGNNDVDAGVARVNWLFREDLMKINPWNVEGIDELNTIEFDENEKIKKFQADHFCEALRVGILSIHIDIQSPEMNKPKTLEEKVMELESMRKQSGDDIFGDRYET